MKRRTFYLGLLLLFGAGLAAILVAPELALTVLTVAVPTMIVAAFVSVAYLRRIYGRQPVPRSRFFGMLLETFYALLVLGIWVGYLTVARVTERAQDGGTIDWSVPAPGTMTSAPVSALLVVVVFAGPVRFAAEVYRERRRARSTTRSLDRDNLREM